MTASRPPSPVLTPESPAVAADGTLVPAVLEQRLEWLRGAVPHDHAFWGDSQRRWQELAFQFQPLRRALISLFPPDSAPPMAGWTQLLMVMAALSRDALGHVARAIPEVDDFSRATAVFVDESAPLAIRRLADADWTRASHIVPHPTLGAHPVETVLRSPPRRFASVLQRVAGRAEAAETSAAEAARAAAAAMNSAAAVDTRVTTAEARAAQVESALLEAARRITTLEAVRAVGPSPELQHAVSVEIARAEAETQALRGELRAARADTERRTGSVEQALADAQQRIATLEMAQRMVGPSASRAMDVDLQEAREAETRLRHEMQQARAAIVSEVDRRTAAVASSARADHAAMTARVASAEAAVVDAQRRVHALEAARDVAGPAASAAIAAELAAARAAEARLRSEIAAIEASARSGFDVAAQQVANAERVAREADRRAAGAERRVEALERRLEALQRPRGGFDGERSRDESGFRPPSPRLQAVDDLTIRPRDVALPEDMREDRFWQRGDECVAFWMERGVGTDHGVTHAFRNAFADVIAARLSGADVGYAHDLLNSAIRACAEMAAGMCTEARAIETSRNVTYSINKALYQGKRAVFIQNMMRQSDIPFAYRQILQASAFVTEPHTTVARAPYHLKGAVDKAVGQRAVAAASPTPNGATRGDTARSAGPQRQPRAQKAGTAQPRGASRSGSRVQPRAPHSS